MTNIVQELIHYLNYIYNSQSHILNDDEALIPLLDSRTVFLIKLLIPRDSLHNRLEIKNLIKDSYLFLAVISYQVRSGILERLNNFLGRIPSLYIFFEDIKYFKLYSKVVKRLLLNKFKRIVQIAMGRAYLRLN